MALDQSTIAFVPFATAPFPYDGPIPSTGEPFLDTVEDGRRGHSSPRGGLLWEDETYSDPRTLLFAPAGFDPDRPATLVVFLHGNNATLERDVVDRQRLPAQLEASGLNAILAAPQLAYDAPDSSAGGFWQPGAFRRWLAEAAEQLALMLGDPSLRSRLDALPVVLVAYSGGYNPAAYALTVGGAGERICGVVLLDALYGEEALFADWIFRRGAAFFLSAYSPSTEDGNRALQALLEARGIAYDSVLADPPPAPGAAAFLPVAEDVLHEDFVTRAWRANPVQGLLAALADRSRCGG